MKTNFMKVRSVVGLVGMAALLLPTLTFAAGNDVTLTTSTVLSVGGYMLDVTGSNATVQSIVVNSSNFAVTLASGSSLTVTSPTHNQLTTDISTFTTSNTCLTNNSVLTLASSGGTGTVTVTPTATICSTPAMPAVTYGSNGPIVGSITETPVVPVVAGTSTTTGTQVTNSSSLQAEITALTAQLQALITESGQTVPASSGTPSGTFSFANNLKIGSESSDVLALQQYLNTHGFVIAASGAGSPGNETTYFGTLTQAAVKALQTSWGLPSTGYFGPMTRAKINQ